MDGIAHTLQDLLAVEAVGLGKDHREFFAAIARHRFTGAADGVLQCLCYLAQDRIPGHMAVMIVVGLNQSTSMKATVSGLHAAGCAAIRGPAFHRSCGGWRCR
jgi:hypothetical protein